MKKVAVSPSLLKLSEITSSVTTVKDLQENVDTVVEAVQCVREMTKVCDLVLKKFSKVITRASVENPLFIEDYEVDINIQIAFGKDPDIIQDIKNFLESKNYKFKRLESFHYLCKTKHFKIRIFMPDPDTEQDKQEVVLSLYVMDL